MAEELRKEHQQFEREIDLYEHGTKSTARRQLASRVYNDLKDSKWAKNLYEKCIEELKSENEHDDDKKYYYENLALLANEIYNNFDKKWAENIYEEIIKLKEVDGMHRIASNLASGEKADENTKKRAKDIFLQIIEPECLKKISDEDLINHLCGVASIIENTLDDTHTSKEIYTLAEKTVKSPGDLLTIGYFFSYDDNKDKSKYYYEKARKIANTGEDLFAVGMAFNEIEDSENARNICKEALLLKFTDKEIKEWREEQFKDTFG